MRRSRREFVHHALTAGGGLLTGAALVPSLDAALGLTAPVHAAAAKSRVALVRRKGVTRVDGSVRADVVQQMVFAAVSRATGQGSPRDAFASLFRPDDVVGIKVNCLAGKRMSTQPAVALALAAGLQLAGLKPANVIIWERSSRELERAGYAVARASTGVRVFGTDGDYESQPTDAGSVGGCMTRLVTQICSAQINAPILKDHDLAGVSLGMKNWYGAIHNPNKYHDNQCAPYVADLSGKSVLRRRTRLVVCDALFGQCHGGPAHSGDFVWRYDGVLASTDPVALDAVGAQIIERQRRKKGLPTLAESERPPRWLADAVRLGLGVADTRAIEVLES